MASIHYTHRKNLFRVLAIMVLLSATIWVILPWGQALEEGVGLDILFRLRGPQPPPSKVVIVALNENTSAALGLPERRENWPRSVYAQLVDQLTELEAKLIVFDLYFREQREPLTDLQFARSLGQSARVILFAFTERRITATGRQQLLIDRILEPIESLQKAAVATAPFMLPKVSSKVTRYWIRWEGYPGRWTLPVTALIHGARNPAVIEQQLGMQRPSLVYNFYGPPRTINTLALQDVLSQAQTHGQVFKDAVVFVGYSADYQPGQKDGFYTPFTAASGLDISGVELAATAFANLHQGSVIRYHLWIWVVALVVYGSAIFFAGLRLALLPGLALILVLALLYAGSTYLVFSRGFYWLPLVTPLLLLTPIAIMITAWHRVSLIAVQKSRLETTFGRYLPAAEIRRLASSPERFSQRETLFGVCLATDAEGYTSIAEKLGPERLSELMEEYYAAVIAPIRAHGGIISDVAGDGVIAIWPHMAPEDVWSTIKPTLQALTLSLQRFNQQNPYNMLPTRIGVHAGECVLGHFGASDHFEYRAIGDLVNTTSRIENANKALGLRTILSAACLGLERDSELRLLGKFLLQGKQLPLTLYSPLEPPWDHSQEQRFRTALGWLEGDSPERGIAEVEGLSRDAGDPVCAFYLRCCGEAGWREKHRSGASIVFRLSKN